VEVFLVVVGGFDVMADVVAAAGFFLTPVAAGSFFTVVEVGAGAPDVPVPMAVFSCSDSGAVFWASA
jgi:hypothetical protein